MKKYIFFYVLSINFFFLYFFSSDLKKRNFESLVLVKKNLIGFFENEAESYNNYLRNFSKERIVENLSEYNIYIYNLKKTLCYYKKALRNNSFNSYNNEEGYFKFPVYFYVGNGIYGFEYIRIKEREELEKRYFLCKKLLEFETKKIIEIYEEKNYGLNFIFYFLKIGKTNPPYYNNQMIKFFDEEKVPVKEVIN